MEFLTFEAVLAIHADQLATYGGADGILDEGVVRAALAAPAHTFGGQYLNEDVAAMAAAYLFSFAASQGFIDGNKRTAVGCVYEFLATNGYDLDCSSEDLYDVTMRVANRLLDKDGAAEWVRDRIAPAL
ncbi:MAG: putative death-on-curing family protein [Phycisphaerales bacterium]|nr:putative death-on-curing family protein [Phycisphaerales bacterium]